GDPTLIGSLDDQIFGQMSVDWFAVIGVSCMDIPWFASAAQASLPHHSLDPLVIDLPALASQGLGHPSIAIASKILAQLLQRLAKRLIALSGSRPTPMLVIPLTVDVEQLTQLAHRDSWHQFP